MLYLLYDSLRSRLIDWNIDWLFMVLDQIEFRALTAAALAFFIVVLFGRRVIAWLRSKRIGDTGLTDAAALNAHSAGKANTPTMGGLLVVGAIAIATVLLADIMNFYVVLGLVVLVWLAALGGLDDWLKLTAATRPNASRQGLRAWEKLVFQLGLGVLVGYFAYRHGDAVPGAPDLAHVLNIPFQKTYALVGSSLPAIDGGASGGGGDGGFGGGGFGVSPGLWYLSLPVFVIVATLFLTGMSNAVNITDGMDGLASGVTVAVSLGLVVLTFVAGSESAAQRLLVPFVVQSNELLVLVSALCGACLGFLWWNCSPAHVFMGDTGSLCLGGLIAYVALVIRQEVSLLIMSGIFLWEIASVVIQVLYFKATRGQRFFKCAPYHHHLHLLGWTEQQVVARFWIISALLVVVALALVKVR